MAENNTKKYKVNSLATDIDVKPKDIIGILDENGFKGRKNVSVIEGDDFGIILNELTLKRQISSMNAYLDGNAVISVSAAEKIEKKVEEKTAIKSEVTTEAVSNGNRSEIKTEEKKAEVKPETKAEEKKPEIKTEDKKAQDNFQTSKDNNGNAPAKNANAANNNHGNSNVSNAQNAKNGNYAGNSNNSNNGIKNNGNQQKNNVQNNNQSKTSANNGNNQNNNKNTPNSNTNTNSDKNRARSQQQFTRPIAPVQKNQKKDRPAAPQKQQQFKHDAAEFNEPVKVLSEGSGTIGKSKIVDTRSSNVDLSKFDEKNNLIDDSMDMAGEKQKLKKQSGKENVTGGKDKVNKDKGREKGSVANSKSRDMKFAGRDFSAKKMSDKEKAAAEKLKRQELEKARKAQLVVSIPDSITVGELAQRLKVTAGEVVKKLFMLGVPATINQSVDYDTAYLVADELGAKVTKEVTVTIEEKLFTEEEDSEENLIERAPVVCVMGHVDHGKTSLLDRIRNSNVTAGEAGGITQAIGAYRVNVKGKDITFLDTPGHEAFTAMRARGAKATDIAILVVAADDGIMPQTVEAISHAKDAGLEIIVAINKMDKPGADPEHIKQELTKYELIPEDWGGDVMCVPVSAHTGMGIDELLEDVLLIAEMKQYRANPSTRAKGVVIESRLDKGRGPIATILVQKGTLHSGDVIIAGSAVGHVRAMLNENGRSLKEAGPSVPVEIAGLDEVPSAGDEFNAVEDERMARELADQRKAKAKEAELKSNSNVSLDDLFAAINSGVKELKIIVKADVDGSAEAVKQSLEKLSNDEVKVKIIHTGIGGITEGDVMFATASNAIIVGFNVRPDKNAIDSAERQKVDIRTYRIIYECIEEIEAAMKGMLAPTYKESLLGHAEVRQTIHVPNVGTIAGSYITDGCVKRSALIRVLRDSIVIFEDKISSLRRFKDDKAEVAEGYECGIGLEKFNDIKVGDILEAYEMVEA